MNATRVLHEKFCQSDNIFQLNQPENIPRAKSLATYMRDFISARINLLNILTRIKNGGGKKKKKLHFKHALILI